MSQYILKNKDIDVLSFEITKKEFKSVLTDDTDFSQKIENIDIIKPELLPINLNLDNIELNLNLWIKDRKIPENRQFVENIVATYSANGEEQLMDYIDISLGLSLNDSFWIVPANENYQWKDFNLYQNDFSEALEKAAFGEELQRIQARLNTRQMECSKNAGIKKMDKFIFIKAQANNTQMVAKKHIANTIWHKLLKLWVLNACLMI